MTTSTDLRADGRAARAQASRWLLAVGIAGSALAVGTVHTVTLCVVTVVLAAAAVLGWWGAEPMRARSAATVLLLTGVGLTAYTALQCVPMPIGWLAAIAPHNADVWSRALAPLHEAGPRWAPISLDPIATRVEGLKGVAYLLAFVTALRVARRKEGVGFLSAVIVATGVALALAAVLHPAFGERKLFGLFEPGPGIPDRHVAPLMNPNQLAAYLNIALCLALAAALSPDPKVPRVVAVALALVLVAVQIWVSSRGGVVAMVLGGLLVAALARAARSRSGAPKLGLSLLSGIAAVAGVAMIALSSDAVQGELFESDVSKVELFGQAMRVVPAHLIFGAGRGSFESIFPAFRGAFRHMANQAGYVTFAYPENILAQWSSEWGVPMALGGFAAIIWALRPTAALARSTNAAGAWAALVAVAVHNFGDFSSEVPGIMLTLAVCAAVVSGGTVGRKGRWKVEDWCAAPKAVAVLSVSGATIAIVSGIFAAKGRLSEDEKELHDVAILHPGRIGDLKSLARAAMLRHPAEPYLPFIVGLRASQERAPEAIAWIGATLERANIYGPAHLVLARVIGVRSPAQARLEYRFAMEQAPELIDVVLKEVLPLVGGYWDAIELAPKGALGARVLNGLVSAVSDCLPSTRVRLDEELAVRSPTLAAPVVRAASDAVEDLESSDRPQWCAGDAREQCSRRALELSKAARDLDPTACAGFALHARALVASADSKRGLDELERATDTVRDCVTCLGQLVAVASKANDGTVVESTLEKIVRAGCSDAQECAQNLVFVARQEEVRGSPRVALAMFTRAYEQTPDDDDLLAQMARLAAAAQLHAQALKDYEKLAKRHPGEKQWAVAVAKERDAAMRETL